MGCDRNSLETERGMELRQRFKKECKDPIHVEMRVRTIHQHSVGFRAGGDFPAGLPIHNHGLDVGLAYIEHCDVHGIIPCERL
jgi:hypothetical protein